MSKQRHLALVAVAKSEPDLRKLARVLLLLAAGLSENDVAASDGETEDAS